MDIDQLFTQARLSCIDNCMGADKLTKISQLYGIGFHNNFGHSGRLKIVVLVFAIFHIRSETLVVITIIFSIP